jgi:hypothetical protein
VSDKRRATRHPVDLPCTLRDEATRSELATRIVNLSIGGALIAHARTPMGQRLHLTFRVPTLAEEAIAIGAVVRWSTDHEIGLQFDGLRPKEVWALSKYIESL